MVTQASWNWFMREMLIFSIKIRLTQGRWQIMIHGESYKPIVAEAAKVNADKTFNRIMVTHLLMDPYPSNPYAHNAHGLQDCFHPNEYPYNS
jgi:hypothetical protein